MALQRYRSLRIQQCMDDETYFMDICEDLGAMLGSFHQFPRNVRSQIREDLGRVFSSLSSMKELNSIRSANNLVEGAVQQAIMADFAQLPVGERVEAKASLRSLSRAGRVSVALRNRWADGVYGDNLPPNHIDRIHEVMQTVFDKLNHEDVLKAKLVCNNWARIGSDAALWDAMLKSDQYILKRVSPGLFRAAPAEEPNLVGMARYKSRFRALRWNQILSTRRTRAWCRRCARPVFTRDLRSLVCNNNGKSSYHLCRSMSQDQVVEYVLHGFDPN